MKIQNRPQATFTDRMDQWKKSAFSALQSPKVQAAVATAFAMMVFYTVSRSSTRSTDESGSQPNNPSSDLTIFNPLFFSPSPIQTKPIKPKFFEILSPLFLPPPPVSSTPTELPLPEEPLLNQNLPAALATELPLPEEPLPHQNLSAALSTELPLPEEPLLNQNLPAALATELPLPEEPLLHQNLPAALATELPLPEEPLLNQNLPAALATELPLPEEPLLNQNLPAALATELPLLEEPLPHQNPLSSPKEEESQPISNLQIIAAFVTLFFYAMFKREEQNKREGQNEFAFREAALIQPQPAQQPLVAVPHHHHQPAVAVDEQEEQAPLPEEEEKRAESEEHNEAIHHEPPDADEIYIWGDSVAQKPSSNRRSLSQLPGGRPLGGYSEPGAYTSRLILPPPADSENQPGLDEQPGLSPCFQNVEEEMKYPDEEPGFNGFSPNLLEQAPDFSFEEYEKKQEDVRQLYCPISMESVDTIPECYRFQLSKGFCDARHLLRFHLAQNRRVGEEYPPLKDFSRNLPFADQETALTDLCVTLSIGRIDQYKNIWHAAFRKHLGEKKVKLAAIQIPAGISPDVAINYLREQTEAIEEEIKAHEYQTRLEMCYQLMMNPHVKESMKNI